MYINKTQKYLMKISDILDFIFKPTMIMAVVFSILLYQSAFVKDIFTVTNKLPSNAKNTKNINKNLEIERIAKKYDIMYQNQEKKYMSRPKKHHDAYYTNQHTKKDKIDLTVNFVISENNKNNNNKDTNLKNNKNNNNNKNTNLKNTKSTVDSIGDESDESYESDESIWNYVLRTL
jgi:hypothetical protein